MKTGIYAITCLPTRKVYIGQSINISKRWWTHRKQLNANIHQNNYLQNSWNKYMPSAFAFSIIRECEKEELLELERLYIKQYDATNFEKGFNVCINCEEKHNKNNSVNTGKARGRSIVVLNAGDGLQMGTFMSLTQAAKELQLNAKRIQEVTSGKKKTYKGYVFIYEDQYDCQKSYLLEKKEAEPRQYVRKGRPDMTTVKTAKWQAVRLTDKDGNTMEFDSQSQAARHIGGDPKYLQRAVRKNRKYKGYKAELIK